MCSKEIGSLANESANTVASNADKIENMVSAFRI